MHPTTALLLSDEWQPFKRAIQAAPHDDLPRGIAADWLEENGTSEYPNFIRLQCEWAALACPVADEKGPVWQPSWPYQSNWCDPGKCKKCDLGYASNALLVEVEWVALPDVRRLVGIDTAFMQKTWKGRRHYTMTMIGTVWWSRGFVAVFPRHVPSVVESILRVHPLA